MLAIHPDARTTPAVRAEIARSAEPTGELARRYGVSTETVREWRKRGPAECRDRSSRPHKLPWKASEEERAVVCELRRATGFPLDDLTFVVRHFLPHLDRDNVYRILKAAGLSRRPAPARPETPAGKFKEYELGFVHVDVKPLPELRTSDGELRKRFLSLPRPRGHPVKVRHPALAICSWAWAGVKMDFAPGSGGFANEPDHPRRVGWRRSEPGAGSRPSSRRKRSSACSRAARGWARSRPSSASAPAS